MHAGARPDADRRLSCPGVGFRQANRVKTFQRLPTLAKGFLTGGPQVLWKSAAFGLNTDLAKNPKIQQKAARQNFQTCPLLLKEMFSKSPHRYAIGQV